MTVGELSTLRPTAVPGARWASYTGPVTSTDAFAAGPDRGLERTPPQDLAAERGVLGGMMLSKDAIADVVEVVMGADFYRPAHQIIFDVILDLYGRGRGFGIHRRRQPAHHRAATALLPGPRRY